jgi:tryptophan-rich sensory protein
MNKTLKLVISVVICQLAGIVGSIFTTPEISGWYKTLNKPFFQPPNWLFGPVWTLLFLLMGISLYLVWGNNWQIKFEFGNLKGKAWNKYSQKFWIGNWQKANLILVFVVQLGLNVLWSYLFFKMHNLGLAFFGLLALWFAILYTILNFYRVSKYSAYLLIPYILWVSFAGILNLAVWLIN